MKNKIKLNLVLTLMMVMCASFVSAEVLVDEVGDDEMNYAEVTLVDFTNDADFITEDDINHDDWDAAYAWGDHASIGYLESFDETDPIFSASDVASVSSGDISDWEAAYSWGDHSSEGYIKVDTNTQLDETAVDAFVANNGYLTSYTETDSIFTAWDKSTGIVITESQISDLSHTVDTDTQLDEIAVDAFVANNGYLTSYTETDSIFTAWDKSTGIVITESQISDLSHTIDTNTQLDEAAVDAFVANNGYLTSFTELDTECNLINGQRETDSGINIVLSKGWTEFRLPAHVLSGTDHINGLDVSDYLIETVLSSIDGSYDYIGYYDGSEWLVKDTVADINTMVSFPVASDTPNHAFSIHMTATDSLIIEELVE